METLPIILTKKEVINYFENNKQYSNWIASKLKSKKYIKIRNNLYALVDISTNDIYATRYEIASKISNSSFICYHSALEYYGIANQVFNDVIVGSVTRFNNFIFDGSEYIFKQVNNTKFVNDVISENIRVTSLEKTIIDCIDNPSFSGGIEEVLYSLEQIRYLNEEKLLEILKDINKKFLYQKVGYLFELYNDQLCLSDDFFNECKKHISKKINYFLEHEFRIIELNRKWNLIVPKDVKSILNGGYYK